MQIINVSLGGVGVVAWFTDIVDVEVVSGNTAIGWSGAPTQISALVLLEMRRNSSEMYVQGTFNVTVAGIVRVLTGCV